MYIKEKKTSYSVSDIATIAFDPHPPWAKIDNQVKEDHQYMISAMTEQVLGVQCQKSQICRSTFTHNP